MHRSALLLLVCVAAPAAEPALDLINRAWPARWIDTPGAPPQDYGVYHFRKTFDVTAVPARFIVHVSGDNRYELYVNGERASWGPARGDLAHWRYETVDIAGKLRSGKNVLAAVVWNDGAYRAVAQITNQTGFLLQADDPANAAVNSGKGWKCALDRAYSPQPIAGDQITGYHAIGPHERLDAALYPWGWKLADFDDSAWKPAHEIGAGGPRDSRDAPNRWMLVQRPIPLEEQTPEPPLAIRRADGIASSGTFSTLTVPASTKAVLILDQAHLTTAYPEMTVSGGKGASISLRYAEAMYVRKNSKQGPAIKGNRDEIDGKKFYGYLDTYVADGGSHREWRPLFWRTYRYIELTVETAAEPVTIESLRGIYTSYPFVTKASFHVNGGDDEEIQRIISTGWRTARLCAHESYMDCPYYEQLQYAGDARIQMMVSLYMTGDSRLMRNGIEQLDSSRTAEGATYSRAPSQLQQYIPPFSLWWIGMVYDYWMYTEDEAFVKSMLPGVRAVLSFFARYQKASGSLGHVPWWNYVDWERSWPDGEAPADPDGTSAAALDLQLLLAYRWAAELETKLGSAGLASEYTAAAAKLDATIQQTDWDPQRELFADQPSHKTFSQQVNTLAVMAGLGATRTHNVAEKLLTDPSIAQSTIYFRAYTNGILRTSGLGDRYLEQLGAWRQMLSQGLTTWAEWNGDDVRSDCHAWGASPNFELLRTVAGISSAAPGFRMVSIAPHLGKLEGVSASMPHPRGSIRVELRRDGKKLTAEIELPAGVPGMFEWGGQRRALSPGKSRLELTAR